MKDLIRDWWFGSTIAVLVFSGLFALVTYPDRHPEAYKVHDTTVVPWTKVTSLQPLYSCWTGPHLFVQTDSGESFTADGGTFPCGTGGVFRIVMRRGMPGLGGWGFFVYTQTDVTPIGVDDTTELNWLGKSR